VKRILALFLIVVLCCCSACGNNADNNYSDEYTFETDYQYNFSDSLTSVYFTETPYGIYLSDMQYLGYFDDELNYNLLCNNANCLHDDVNECKAYFLMNLNIFYYEESLYIVCMNDEFELCIQEYTLQGDYVKTVAVLPQSLHQIIQHRGVFYYSYYKEDNTQDGSISDGIGFPTVAAVSVNGKKEEVLYQGEAENTAIGWISAYGKYIYFCEDTYGETFKTDTYIYNLETETFSILEDVANIYFSNSRLIFNKQKGDRKTVYSSALDGSNVQATELVMNYDSGLLGAFGPYVIESNAIEYTQDSVDNNTYVQTFTVYKDNKLEFSFTLQNVDGEDYSKTIVPRILSTDEYIFMPMSHNAIRTIVAIDMEQFVQGRIEPTVVYTPNMR